MEKEEIEIIEKTAKEFFKNAEYDKKDNVFVFEYDGEKFRLDCLLIKSLVAFINALKKFTVFMDTETKKDFDLQKVIDKFADELDMISQMPTEKDYFTVIDNIEKNGYHYSGIVYHNGYEAMFDYNTEEDILDFITNYDDTKEYMEGSVNYLKKVIGKEIEEYDKKHCKKEYDYNEYER